MRRIAAAAAVALAVTVVACGGDDESSGGNGTPSQPPNLSASPSGGIDIRGEITQLTTPDPGVNTGALVVDGEVEADTKYKKAVVRMKDTTVIQRKQGEEIFPASVVDLEVGKRVEIKFTGVVAELNPTQAAAGEITILE
jgi:hypothetical protein